MKYSTKHLFCMTQGLEQCEDAKQQNDYCK